MRISEAEEVLGRQIEHRPEVLIVRVTRESAVVVRPAVVDHVNRLAVSKPRNVLVTAVERAKRRNTCGHPVIRDNNARANSEVLDRNRLKGSA